MKTKQPNLAKSLEARVPFDVSKPMFKLLGIARGRGWAGTVEKLTEKNFLKIKEKNNLLGALKDHELTGEKLCSYFHVDQATLSAMRTKLIQAKVSTGPMQTAYPLLLSDAALAKIPLSEPELLSVEKVTNGLAAVFSSVRALRVREPVNAQSFPKNAAKLLACYDEVVGVKLIRYQAIDVVCLPDSGDVIDLRVDYPHRAQADIGKACQNLVMDAFSKVVGTTPFKTPINLFPLLSKMYDAANEGRVVEIAFGTTTRSIKHERMRVSADCLREELYHMGGKKNLNTPVRPHRLSIAYTFTLGHDIQSHPELSLHTTTLNSENPNPQLYDAIIRKTVGLADYDHVRQRLLHFL